MIIDRHFMLSFLFFCFFLCFFFFFLFFFCILIPVKMIIDRVGAGFSPVHSHLGKPTSSTRTHHQSDRAEDFFLASSTYVYLFLAALWKFHWHYLFSLLILFFPNLNLFFVTSQMVFKEYCY